SRLDAVSYEARLEPERLREATRQLARGVLALHQAGKVHRDIKPSNIMVVEGTPPRVVLMDFGLGTEAGEATGAPQGASPTVVGTPLYMAPEQAAGRPAGLAADWYSVGAVLYQALTGRPPFTGTALQVLAAKQLRDPVAPREFLPEIPADLEAL